MGMCVRVRRGLVAIGLLFSVAFFGLAGVVVVAAQPESGVTATAIVVQGNRRVEAETVRSYFRVVPGERLDAAKIDAALKALYASLFHSEVEAQYEGARIRERLKATKNLEPSSPLAIRSSSRPVDSKSRLVATRMLSSVCSIGSRL